MAIELDFGRLRTAEESMARALYIHWPFCLAKCPYCDFNSHVRERVDNKLWERSLLTDMRREAEAGRWGNADLGILRRWDALR
jgi:oxygen-independent coproporphyrinogen-3 oxidase